ncbi:MAG TPA: hypothetical protein VHI13_06140 [Candidatus Kapabacteria bacterium]|nr:hypothetical protein [Candidatus Kapabacteria bacterium]
MRALRTTSIRLAAGALCLVLAGVLVSSHAAAQGSGPAQSEFSSPGGAGGNAGVDEFSGAFNYNVPVLSIPGPQGSGFDVTLSYRSGAPIAQDASWVGYGWTLNTGAITRDRRGFPDDWKGTVKYWNKTKKFFSVTATRKLDFEILSKDLADVVPFKPTNNNPGNVSLNLSLTTMFNNATGYSRSFGVGAWAKGLMSMNYTSKNDGGSFSVHVDPGLAVAALSKVGLFNNLGKDLQFGISAASLFASAYINSAITQEQHVPTPVNLNYHGGSSNYSAKFMAALNPAFLSGIEGGVEGNYTWYENDPSTTLNAFGYMYSASATGGDAMDYYTERQVAYRRENPFLPVPFSNADNFLVAGTGMGGSFRLYNRGAGIFHPNSTGGKFSIVQVGVDLAAGARFGIGGNLGLGSASFSAGEWDKVIAMDRFRFQQPGDRDPYIFRFHGDLGGSLRYGANDDVLSARLLRFTPDGDVMPHLADDVYDQANNGGTIGRNTFVGYHTNAEMNRTTDQGVFYDSFTKDSLTRSLVDRSDAAILDQIGEFCITNANGMRYVYGLPVYARSEKDIQLGLPKNVLDSTSRMNSKFIAHAYLSAPDAPVVIGQERPAPYASTYLLTLITTPDYIDRTNNGPTPDDFGGYTKFNYVRAAGTRTKSSSLSGSWFAWRQPYNGLLYSRNTLSDPTDDLGSFSSGEREVYYLKSIETKTHIAYFVTNRTNVVVNGHRIKGSLTQRLDAYQAYHTPSSQAEALIAGDSTLTQAGYTSLFGGTYYPNANAAQRLERIELYAKDADGNPATLIKTVHFEYDSSLRQGLPNARRTEVPPSTIKRPGMLTLKKLWWSEGDVANAEYSPYMFGYEYKRAADYSHDVEQHYGDIAHFADALSSAEQNPDYSPVDIDAWGNYQLNGGTRYVKMQPWVNQVPDTSSFDPAAWQLKWIRTPSLGEVHVQYEQNRYSYVQDHPAMGMVSLNDTVSNDDVGGTNKYYLNTGDIGVPDTNAAAVNALAVLMRRTFMQANAAGAKERAYFKLLYALKGGTPHLDDTYTGDYIRGYAPVDNIGVDVISGTHPRYRLYVSLKGDRIPKQICGEFVMKNKLGLMGPDDGVAFTDNGPGMISTLLFQYARAGYTESEHCQAIDFHDSYIRVPLLYPKLGGGVRVRRLLTYDPGNAGDSALTGSEYIYDDYDDARHEHVSSGVAVNEPSACREENALVNVWGTEAKPDMANKIIAGEDLGRYEGMPGESLLPAASVGYSRVVVRSIHTGRSNPGFSIARYFTAKDYPFFENYSGIGRSVDYSGVAGLDKQTMPWENAAANMALSQVPYAPAISFYEDDLWMSQGYRFVLNDMHGQFRSRAAYSGTYANKDSWTLASSQEVSYFQPGEKIPMLAKPGDVAVMDTPGAEMEIAHDRRSYDNAVVDGKLEGDFSILPAPPFTISLSGQGYLETTSGTLATFVTSKVTRYPTIQKGVVSYADGVYHYSRNEAFDPLSGAPVIVHTADGFDGLALEQAPTGQLGAYHSYNFPAAERYTGMGQIANNEHQLLRHSGSLSIVKHGSGSVTITPTSTDSLCPLRSLFTQGDLIHLTAPGGTSDLGLFHVNAVTVGLSVVLDLRPVSTSVASTNTTTGNADIEVIRSGYTNQLNASAGSIATYGSTETQIQTGADIDLQPASQIAARGSFISNLNTLVHTSGGSISQTTMQSMGVAVQDPVTGMCNAMSVWVGTNILTGQPVISVNVPSPAPPQMSTDLAGIGGHFALDADGNLVYYGCVSGCCPQPVTCIQFCSTTQPQGPGATNVIAASATTYDNVSPYDSIEIPHTPSDANEFEYGARGKWRPRASFLYRTGIVGGSGHSGIERDYKGAGTFTDFQLFNWNSPASSLKWGKWFRTDSVTQYSPYGEPQETVDINGVYSSLKACNDHTGLLLMAANANYGSVAFQNFESSAAGVVVMGAAMPGIAHTGFYSRSVTGAVSTASLASVRITDQTVNKGLSIRFWMKVTDPAIVAPAGSHSISVHLSDGGWSQTFRISPTYKVAQTGEWSLYEVTLNPFPAVPAGTTLSMSLDASLSAGADTAWIDDIRMQPLDAVVTTFVVDRDRQRLMAGLDDQHFALYNQYNAEGRLLRQRKETARGVRTTGEQLGNLPMLKRYDNTVVPDPGGAPNGTRRKGGNERAYTALAGERVSPKGPRIDLLDAEVNADGIRTRTLGSRQWKPFDPRSLASFNLDSIGAPEIPALKKLEWMKQLATIEDREHAARDSAAAATDIATRAACNASVEELHAQRAELLGKLGISEAEWAALKDEAQSAGTEKKEEDAR